MSALLLRPAPLTVEAFRAYGDVIECRGPAEALNDGTTAHFADLARVSVSDDGGRVRVGIYRVTPYELPMAIRMVERHPLGSQLFMPLHDEPFLIVVAGAGEIVKREDLRAFVTNGRQGVNYLAGTWHHPVIALRDSSEMLVVDRAGPQRNCDVLSFAGETIILQPPRAQGPDHARS